MDDGFNKQPTANGQILSSGPQPYQTGAYPGGQGTGYQPMMQTVQMVPGVQPIQPAMPGVPNATVTGQNMPSLPEDKHSGSSGLGKTIAIIILALALVTFIGLFIWMFLQYNEANTDLEGKLEAARLEAADAQKEQDYADFAEEEKDPYTTFAGPVDYGSLSFQFPKTWSVYVDADGLENGEDFEAYLNPVEIEPIDDKSSIHAVEVKIQNEAFDTVAANYQKYVEKKKEGLTIQSVTIGLNKNITANLYKGTIPGKEDLTGYIAIFKIRDKTAILQTDSTLFWDDFNNVVLNSVTFNE